MNDPAWHAQRRAIARDRGRLRQQLTTVQVPAQRGRIRLAIKALQYAMRDQRMAANADAIAYHDMSLQ